MSISGLLITLANTPESLGSICAWLATHPGFTAGTPYQHYLPASLEAADSDEAQCQLAELQQVPGVLLVDVVFVSVEEGLEAQVNTAS
jgi:hypothetical protein